MQGGNGKNRAKSARFKLRKSSKIYLLLKNDTVRSQNELNLYRVYIMERIVDAGRILPNLDY